MYSRVHTQISYASSFVLCLLWPLDVWVVLLAPEILFTTFIVWPIDS